jgi:hypothetical protein
VDDPIASGYAGILDLGDQPGNSPVVAASDQLDRLGVIEREHGPLQPNRDRLRPQHAAKTPHHLPQLYQPLRTHPGWLAATGKPTTHGARLGTGRFCDQAIRQTSEIVNLTCLFKQRTHVDSVARNHDYVVKSSATVGAVVEQAAQAGERCRRRARNGQAHERKAAREVQLPVVMDQSRVILGRRLEARGAGARAR